MTGDLERLKGGLMAWFSGMELADLKRINQTFHTEYKESKEMIKTALDFLVEVGDLKLIKGIYIYNK